MGRDYVIDIWLLFLHFGYMKRAALPLPFTSLSLVRNAFIQTNKHVWHWESIPRDHHNLWICLSGEATFELNGRLHDIVPWTAVVIPPDAQFNARCTPQSPHLKNFAVHWKPTPQKCKVEASVTALKDIDTAQNLLQALVKLTIYNDELYSQQSEALLIALLGMISREHQQPGKTQDYESIIAHAERINSGEWLFESVENLAGALNISRVHYTRKFKTALGVSPTEFMLKERMRHAINLLTNTNWTLETIAETIGYKDVFFFVRQFKAHMGISPGKYRKQRSG